MDVTHTTGKLAEKGLKVTPQRIAVFESIVKLNNHPTAENIIEFIRNNHPNISVGTVYKILDVFVENGLVMKVKTDKDVMRYDAVIERHHHIYCSDSDKIEDYFDPELSEMLERYFREKQIPGFNIEYVNLQITGKYTTQPRNLKTSAHGKQI